MDEAHVILFHLIYNLGGGYRLYLRGIGRPTACRLVRLDALSGDVYHHVGGGVVEWIALNRRRRGSPYCHARQRGAATEHGVLQRRQCRRKVNARKR